MTKYAVEFKDSRAYEDNIRVVFLVNDARDGYDCIAIVGDNVAEEIYNMFGNQYTAFGQTVIGNIPNYYENSLGRNLASAINTMTSYIEALDLDKHFTDPSATPSGTKAHLTNLSSLAVNNTLIADALTNFTDKTDIPIALVIDDVQNVYKSENSGVFDFSRYVLPLFVAIIFGGVGIYLIVMVIKKRKTNQNGSQNSKNKDDDPKNDSTHW